MKGIIMGKMKEYKMDRGYDCCDGINLCIDCHYHEETSKYYGKWKPTLKSWYNKTQKKATKIIKSLKTKKIEIPF